MSKQTRSTSKHYLPYIALIGTCALGLWLILSTGSRLYSPAQPLLTPTVQSIDQSQSITTSQPTANFFWSNLRNPLSILLLQLVIIIVASRFVGRLFRRIGQPPVLGEIVAGIILGPSLLGLISPGTMAFLFPPASMEMLRLMGQIGVAIFMFIVGMELDVGRLRQKAHTAIMVSNASVIAPFFLGTSLALLVYPSLASPRTSFTSFALFMGIAMSITAFPVLARILDDRRMSQTDLGIIALTCAAADDVTAWCILALVIAFAQSGSAIGSLLTIGLALIFILVMLLIIKPQLPRILKHEPQKQSRGLLTGIVAFALACALVTELIGIHSLFGAFLAGVVMPASDQLRIPLKEKLEPLVTATLLPLFFAFTGLRMQSNLLNDWQSWAICALIVIVAIAGKLGASTLMARWCGMNWRDSFSLGALMNTRGLVELIVLNIGYDLGILSARSFAMFILMTLITTFMTGPLLTLVKKHAV
jgi:Kef-type K+ transport system membrane component KefB